MKRQLILAEFSRQPWAMDPDYLATFESVLRRWSAGEPATPEIMATVEEAQAARVVRAKTNANVGGGIAVLPLYGAMVQRASMVSSMSGSGGTSTQAFSAALRDALADDTVGGIIIDIDSPGGSVFGTAELAAEIFNARQQKPIFGYVNSRAASAAYWVGTQCSQLFSTQGGMCGSIGVFMSHDDESGALAAKGVKTTYISAGKYKTEANPTGPLDTEALAFLQSQVDSFYSSFTSAVAKGRGVPIATVRDGMGQGRNLLAADALSANMIDGICSFEDVIAKMQKTIKLKSSANASSAISDVSVTDEGNADTPIIPQPTPQYRSAIFRRRLDI